MKASPLGSVRTRRPATRTPAAPLACLAAILVAASTAVAADSSLWDTTNGVWSDPNNWLSTINGVSNLHVVPGQGFEIALTPDADVTQDIDASVLDVLGYATTSLTVNANKSLEANGLTGIVVGYLFIGSIADGGSTVSATAIGAQNKLDVYNSVLTAPNITSSDSAFIESSTLSTLSAVGYVHINKSFISNNSALPAFSNLTVNATFDFSDVTNSYFNGSLLIDMGASLLVDQGSVITTPTSGVPYSILINQGNLTLKNASILDANLVAPQMGAGIGAASFLIDGPGTAFNLNGVDFTIAGVSNSTLTVQNGAVYRGRGTSRLVVGPFSALGIFNGASQVNVTSGSAMTLTDLLVSGSTASAPTSIVTVSDANSTLAASGVIRLTGGAVDIKNQAAASATLMIDLQYGQFTVESGGSLTSPGPLLVGFNGSGSLTIQGAGVLTSSQGVIAHKAGATGMATVTGAGSQLQTFGDFTVGMLGTGTLSVAQGATVDSGAGIVGDQAAASGKATVSDPGTAWHVGGPLTIGNQQGSTGELTVESKALVATQNAGAIIAHDPNTLGTVTVQSGGKWTVDQQLTVGHQGTGQLSIGGINSEVDDLGATIAALAGSNGAVSVQIGGLWKNTNSIVVADEGSGQLSIDLGARAVAGAALNVANAGGSIGSLTVDGILNIGADLSVGKSGAGSMTVENGGAVAGGNAHVGQAPGAVGNVSLSGANGQTSSSWSVAGTLWIGEGGTGTVTLAATGHLASTAASIGDQADAVGAATVTDTGSNWINSGPLTVGNAGTGSLSIHQGGTVNAASVSLAAQPGSSGSIDLSDDASRLISTGPLTIAAGGKGTLSLDNAAQVQSSGGVVGSGAGSAGVVTITGQGSQWNAGAGTITIGPAAGPGTVTVSAGGKITADTVIVGPAGKLGGDGGSIVATVINSGGIVRPGDAPGILHLNGDFLQNAGTLLFEIDGTQPTQFDQLLVSGQTTLSGGRIELDFNNFVPQPGDQFALLQSGVLTNTGLPIDVTGLPASLGYTAQFTATGLSVTLTTAVPEPATALLLAAAVPAMLRARRRFRKSGS